MVNSTVVNFTLTTEGEKQESRRGMTDITWTGASVLPDRELVDRLSRRGSSAAYKLRILREADECSTPGEVGALLRREGLYMSHLAYWRALQEAGDLQALGEPRGPQFTRRRDIEIADLRTRLEQVEDELAKARKVIAMHGRLSALVENLLEPSARGD
jgi:transposase